ncbi:hypothetical protein MANES_04G052645v8 [Manihot esculenta]|uniref:Uncharacterized protein n=1 Tax=Manihot esculenta TaxID=3983 RepID=A0ACB7HS13_MANES|nr:hypothetical protein MANES_04G052645v8 [Manihot esculenta]
MVFIGTLISWSESDMSKGLYMVSLSEDEEVSLYSVNLAWF